jgi:hypothetical protein
MESGEVPERSNGPPWKGGVSEMVPRVRIPSSPPGFIIESMEKERFYSRAHESRDRLAEESGLLEDPQKYARLKSSTLEIQHETIDSIRGATDAMALGNQIDGISQKIQELFPDDSYGETASGCFLKRVFEKARDEVGDWLVTQNRKDLTEQLRVAATSWRTAEEAGQWIDQHILSQFPDPALFSMARDAKAEEAERYYLSQKNRN